MLAKYPLLRFETCKIRGATSGGAVAAGVPPSRCKAWLSHLYAQT